MSRGTLTILLLILVWVLILIMNQGATGFNFFGVNFEVTKAYVYVGFSLWGIILGLSLR